MTPNMMKNFDPKLKWENTEMTDAAIPKKRPADPDVFIF